MLDLERRASRPSPRRGSRSSAHPTGIRFEPLTDDHPLLGTLVGTDEKFSAHNAALWEHGLLVHVPAGVEVDQPLYLRVANAVEGGSLFWRLLVVAEPGSRFTVIEEYASASAELAGLLERSRRDRRRATGRRWSTSTCRASRRRRGCSPRTTRASSATPSSTGSTGGFGSAKGKVWIQNDLAGQGATSRVTGAYFADGTQHLDYDTYQRHIAPSTTTRLRVQGRAARQRRRAVWRGMIRVEEGAQKTNAYQENRNLLLSKTAHANSIPGLEILANDVRCTHGATLGQVDREQLFYLMARGLSRAEAERLIVRGFFQDVLDRVELEPCARRSAQRSRPASRRPRRSSDGLAAAAPVDGRRPLAPRAYASQAWMRSASFPWEWCCSRPSRCRCTSSSRAIRS